MWTKLKEKLNKFKKWLIALFIGGVAVATVSTVNFNGAIIEPVDNRAVGSDEVLLEGEESLFAKIDADGNVLTVLVISAEEVNKGKRGDPKNWIRTYANGRVRKNYAGVGYKYNNVLGAFVPPKVYDSWILDATTARWKAPKAKPADGKDYRWDESTLNWKLK